MKKYAIKAKTRKKASPKLHLIKRKNDLDSLSAMEEGKEQYELINQAIEAFFIEYTLPNRQPIRPGLNSSTSDADHVYLRSGKSLLAILKISSGKFLALTPKRIKKYSI